MGSEILETQGLEHGDVEESESLEARLQRLGWQRPDIFKSTWAEIGFVFSVVASQIMAEFFISGFNVVLPKVVEDLSIPTASSIWPASAFSLVAASFLLPFGRLADIYGGYPVFILGLAWYCLWSLIASFSVNQLMLDLCRALQGLGPAAFLPSGIMLMGVYRPGPRKNLVYSLYGAGPVVGFFIGIFVAGIVAEYLRWGWFFWIGTILVFLIMLTALFAVHNDMAEREDTDVKMDWLGTILIVPGLVLLVFAITASSHAPNGWATSYIIATLIVGVLFIACAVYVEGWVAEQPLLPFELFQVKQMKPLVLALFFFYGTLGIYLFYATFYAEDVMGASPLQVVAWYVPVGVGGVFLSTCGGLVLHLIPGTIILIISGVGWTIAPLLFAIAPVNAGYWPYIFPAMCCTTIGIDLTYNITNIFITNNMPSKWQGLAGALINSILFLGIAFFLGFADVAASQTASQGLRKSYKAALWFSVACSGTALIIMLLFVKLDKAKADLTEDERREMEDEARREVRQMNEVDVT